MIDLQDFVSYLPDGKNTTVSSRPHNSSECAPTNTNDHIRRLLRLVLEVPLEDVLRARGIARLRVERRARVVRGHAVSAPERVLHRAPGVVARRGLHVPHVACVPVELAGLERSCDVRGVANGAARGVDEECSLSGEGRVSVLCRRGER